MITNSLVRSVIDNPESDTLSHHEGLTPEEREYLAQRLEGEALRALARANLIREQAPGNPKAFPMDAARAKTHNQAKKLGLLEINQQTSHQ